MIGMRMCGNEIVELLDVIPFQRLEYGLAFAVVSGINQNCFTVGRNDQNRITIDRSNIENKNLELAARRRRRLRLPPRQSVFPPNVSSCDKYNCEYCNRTSTASY